MKTSAGPPRNLPRFWTYTFNQVSPGEPQRTRGATHRRPRPQCRIEPSLADIDAAERYSLYHLPVPSLRSGLGDRATVRAAKNGEEAPRSAADLRVSGPRGLSSSGSAWGLSFLAQIEDTRAAELVLDRADALRAVIPRGPSSDPVPQDRRRAAPSPPRFARRLWGNGWGGRCSAGLFTRRVAVGACGGPEPLPPVRCRTGSAMPARVPRCRASAQLSRHRRNLPASRRLRLAAPAAGYH
jgi:hypothetical protein